MLASRSGAPSRSCRSEEHTSELQSHRYLHSFPTRRSSDLPQLVSGVAAIGKDMAQPGKSTANARQQIWRAITILHVGRVDGGSNQQSYRVGEDMALAALDHLFGRIAARTASLGGLDRLAVDHAGGRACLAACRFAYLHQQHMVDDPPCSIVAPSIEIPLHRRERREIRRQHAPLAA